MLLNAGYMKILAALKFGVTVMVGNKYSSLVDGILTDISDYTIKELILNIICLLYTSDAADE